METSNEDKVSPTRTKATWKPRIVTADVPFYICDTCGTVVQGINTACPNAYTGMGRSLEAVPSYAAFEGANEETTLGACGATPLKRGNPTPACCGQPMRLLEPVDPQTVAEQIALSYRIVGGFDHNAVECSWQSGDAGRAPLWVALKTFTGVQVKYVLPGKKPPLVFALADEDAYVYCDEDPCLECRFRCKRGFVLYFYVPDLGLLRLPLDQMTATGSAESRAATGYHT